MNSVEELITISINTQKGNNFDMKSVTAIRLFLNRDSI